MFLRYRVHNHKDKNKKDTTMIISGLCRIQKHLNTTSKRYHTSMSSINVIRGHAIKITYILIKRLRESRTHTRITHKTETLSNKTFCGGIDI